MKVVVYTALFGAGAPPSVPEPPESDVRYVCLTDVSNVAGWQTIRPKAWPWLTPSLWSANPRLASRLAKMRPDDLFPDADVTIWQDASFSWISDPMDVLEVARLTSAPIVGFTHPDRHRISDEACEIVRARKGDPTAIFKQLALYQQMGFDTDAQPQRLLTTTGLLIRWNTSETREFNRLWREQLALSLRDQMSVDFCGWILDVRIGHLPGHYRDNRFVQYHRDRRIKVA